MEKGQEAVKARKTILVIDSSAIGYNRGWERFLQVMFQGIEQIQTRKKHWGPIRDFYRIIGWCLWN